MSKLDEILENKKLEINDIKDLHGEHIFGGGHPVLSFLGAVLKEDRLSITAEVKRKSPSQGEMAMQESPLSVAKLYEENGADAISVLTDVKFFGGSFEFLKEISTLVKIPLLCKDFILDPIQIDLAKLSGASAVLLITDILDDKNLQKLYEYAASCGLDSLVEAHDPQNVKRASELGAKIIGINNRNLFTFEENLNHSAEVRHLIHESAVKMSLSSVKSRADAEKIASAGYDGILMGGVLMKAFNKKAALNSFKNVSKYSIKAAPAAEKEDEKGLFIEV